MKKSLLAIGLTALLFSCKKDEKKEFTATETTGTATLAGTFTKNQLTRNTTGGTTVYQVPAAGANITVRVANSQLYPLSSTASVGSKVYSTTTDANGKYSLNVTTNGNGVTAVITVDDFQATYDTLVNGTTKTGFVSNFAGNGVAGVNRTITTGVPSTYNWNFVPTVLVNSPTVLTLGTGTITGYVKLANRAVSSNTANTTAFAWPIGTAGGVSGVAVMCDFTLDPLTGAVKTYTTTTDANGFYSFTVTNTKISGSYTNVAKIWVNDLSSTLDSVRTDGTNKSLTAGEFDGAVIANTVVDLGQIKHQNNFTYSTFTKK